MTTPPDADRRRSRDKLVGRVSVMSQVTTMVAMTATGIITGVLAHDAQVKDQLAAQARARATQPPAQPPAPTVVHRPVRTVVVHVRPGRRSVVQVRQVAAPARTTTAPAPRQVAAAPPPKATTQAPVTKTSGS